MCKPIGAALVGMVEVEVSNHNIFYLGSGGLQAVTKDFEGSTVSA